MAGVGSKLTMEASSTTLNIASPAIPTTETAAPIAAPIMKHSHGPNFGRFVEDCPKCLEKKERGGFPKKPHTAKPTGLSKDEAIALMKEMLSANAPQMAAAVASGDPAQMAMLVELMLKREAKTLKTEDETAKRREQLKADYLQSAREQMVVKQARESNCEARGHKKENGSSAISGQIHNDGLFHPLCLRCFKELKPYRPSVEQMSA